MNNTENSMMHFRLDYSPPLFAFEGVELDFELNPLKTIVSSKIQLKRLLPGSLTLKGEDLELISIKVDHKIIEDLHEFPLVRKASLWQDMPYERSLFLDADTIIINPIDENNHDR